MACDVCGGTDETARCVLWVGINIDNDDMIEERTQEISADICACCRVAKRLPNLVAIVFKERYSQNMLDRPLDDVDMDGV